MKYYQILVNGSSHLCVGDSGDKILDLTDQEPYLQNFIDLLSVASESNRSIDSITADLIRKFTLPGYIMSQCHLGKPIDPPEVWAAGVTYKRSEQERRLESDSPDIYAKVYSSSRPEIFFKGTSRTLVGYGEDIGIRRDSSWNVPEPELAFVIYDGNIAGYTIGNDVSSRSIEGENPLYLPQAKFYDNSCAIGPCIVSSDSITNPHNLEISMTVMRGGTVIFEGTTSTSQLVRSCDEINDWLQRHNHVPDGTVVLTGTGIIPPPSFSLEPKDICRITVDQIGQLEVGTKEV